MERKEENEWGIIRIIYTKTLWGDLGGLKIFKNQINND